MTDTPPVSPPVVLTPVSTDPPSYLVSLVTVGLRAGLLGLGSVLMHSGYLTQSQSDSLVQWGLGGAVFIAGVAWSVLEKDAKIKQILGLLAALGKK